MIYVFLREKNGRYEVILDGEMVIQRSRDPEHDLARLLLARGITGRVQTLDGLSGKPRMSFDIEAFAPYSMTESGNGPKRTPYKPFPKEGVV